MFFFSQTTRFCMLAYFVKTGNKGKWGKKSISQNSSVNMRHDVSNSLFLITEQE